MTDLKTTDLKAKGLPAKRAGAVMAMKANAAAKPPRGMARKNKAANPAESLARIAKRKIKRPMPSSIAVNLAVTAPLMDQIQRVQNRLNVMANALIEAAVKPVGSQADIEAGNRPTAKAQKSALRTL